MALRHGPHHLRGQVQPTASVGVYMDGDLGISQGKDSVVLDAEQQGQFFAWARKQESLARFFQPSSPTKET